MDLGAFFLDHGLNHPQGELSILQGLPGEAEDEVYMRDETRLPDPAGGREPLPGRMPPVEAGKHRIAPGLGSQDNRVIPAVSLHQPQDFRADPIGTDFGRVTSELNVVDPGLPARAEKLFDGRQVGFPRPI